MLQLLKREPCVIHLSDILPPLHKVHQTALCHPRPSHKILSIFCKVKPPLPTLHRPHLLPPTHTTTPRTTKSLRTATPSPVFDQQSQRVYTAFTASGRRYERCIRQRKKCDGAKPARGNCASSRENRHNCVYPPGNPSRRELAAMQNHQSSSDAVGGHQGTNTDNDNVSKSSSRNQATPTLVAPPKAPQEQGGLWQPIVPPMVAPQRAPIAMPTTHVSVLLAPGLQIQNRRSIYSQPPPRWHPVDGSAQSRLPVTINPAIIRAGPAVVFVQTRAMTARSNTDQPQPPVDAYGGIAQGQNDHLREQRTSRDPSIEHAGDFAVTDVEMNEGDDGNDDAGTVEAADDEVPTGQYPMRFPALNWEVHHVYLADGRPNPSPPHGACTSPTMLGRTAPPP